MIKKSNKHIKKLEEILVNPLFYFPKELANGIQPQTNKQVVTAGINGKNYYFEVEKWVTIPYSVWQILNQSGFIKNDKIKVNIKPNNSFNPLKNET